MALCFDFASTIRRFAVLFLTFNILVSKHSDFLALGFLTGVDVIVTLRLLSLTTSGVDTIAASRISLRFCWLSHLPACWYIFFMLFIHLCSKEDRVHNDWSISIVFIWSSRRDDCTIHLITTNCLVPWLASTATLVSWSAPVARVHPRTAWSPLYADLGLGCEGPLAWHRKGEGGHGTGPWQRLGGQRVRGQEEPTGRGRAEWPRKYSPVGREGIETSTVVRGKGEGGGGAEEIREPRKPRGPRATKGS